jgi:5-methylthioadenosine/S-adenosylhomocysteine deaminase
VHKALSSNPTVLDAKTALLMATRWGSEVLGLGDRIGSIEPGKIADVIIINLDKPHLTPLYNIYSQIVYAAMASDVETVMVNGKMVLNDRKLVTSDEEAILCKAREWRQRIQPA